MSSSPTSSSLRQVQLLLFHVVLTLLGLSSTALGYSFQFTTWPTQCGPLSLALVGGRGIPPYRLLLVPIGDYDGRRVIEHTFSDESNATLAHLPYPENTQFVATLSDASGMGSGGTSVSLNVVATGDLSCLSPPLPPPDFTFSVDSPPRQCGPTQFSWNPSAVQPPLTFYGIIPGGQSFAVPVPNEQVSSGTFTWTSTVRLWSSVMFVAGDARGRTNGGRSTLFSLMPPPPGQQPPPPPPGAPPPPPGGGPPVFCLTNGGYSTTSGYPAGGIYPTGSAMPTPTANNTPNGSSQPSVGVLVGSVVGGVGGLFILGFIGLFLYRKRNFTNAVRAAKRRSAAVDLDEKGVDRSDTPTGDHLIARPLSNHLEPGVMADAMTNGGVLPNGGHAFPNGVGVGGIGGVPGNGGAVLANGGPVVGGGAAASRKQRLSIGPVTPRPLYPDTPSPPLSPVVRFADGSSGAGPGAGLLPSPADSELGDTTRSSQPNTRPNSAGTGSSPTTSRRKSASANSAMGGAGGSGSMPPPVLRSVTYIQHDDAGSVSNVHGNGGSGEQHTVIELPPSYVERRRSVRSAASGRGGGGGGSRSDHGGSGPTRTSPTDDRPPPTLDGHSDSRAMSPVSDDRFHSFEEERPSPPTFSDAPPAPAPTTTTERESRTTS